MTVPVTDAIGEAVTTNDDPHGNNSEGNGITRTSGGAYFAVGNYVYRLTGDHIAQPGFDTKCANGRQNDVTAVISNLPTGDLTTLDAAYLFRLINTGNGRR